MPELLVYKPALYDATKNYQPTLITTTPIRIYIIVRHYWPSLNSTATDALLGCNQVTNITLIQAMLPLRRAMEPQISVFDIQSW